MSSTIIVKFTDGSCYIIVEKRKKAVHFEDAIPLKEENSREEIISKLKWLSSEYNIIDCLVLTSFRYCSSGLVTLPIKQREDIESALPFELEKKLPLPINDYSITFDIIEKQKNSSTVLYCTILQRQIQFYRSIVENAGLQLKALRVGFFEVFKAFVLKKITGLRDYVIVYREEDKYCLANIVDRKIVSIRHIKSEKQLIFEIQESDSLSGKTVFCINCDELNLEGVKTERVEISDQELLKVLSSKKPPFVDFTSNYSEQQQLKYNYSVILLLALTIVLFLSSYLIPYYMDVSTLGKINSEINSIKSKAADVINMNRELQSLKEKVREYEEIKSRALVPMEALNVLTEKIPEHTWLYTFKYNNQYFEIQGLSESATDLIKPLEDDELFKNVRFTSPIVTRNKKDRFRIRMELERK